MHDRNVRRNKRKFEIVQVCDTPVYYLAYCEYPYYEPVFDLLLDF